MATTICLEPAYAIEYSDPTKRTLPATKRPAVAAGKRASGAHSSTAAWSRWYRDAVPKISAYDCCSSTERPRLRNRFGSAWAPAAPSPTAKAPERPASRCETVVRAGRRRSAEADTKLRDRWQHGGSPTTGARGTALAADVALGRSVVINCIIAGGGAVTHCQSRPASATVQPRVDCPPARMYLHFRLPSLSTTRVPPGEASEGVPWSRARRSPWACCAAPLRRGRRSLRRAASSEFSESDASFQTAAARASPAAAVVQWRRPEGSGHSASEGSGHWRVPGTACAHAAVQRDTETVARQSPQYEGMRGDNVTRGEAMMGEPLGRI